MSLVGHWGALASRGTSAILTGAQSIVPQRAGLFALAVFFGAYALVDAVISAARRAVGPG